MMTSMMNSMAHGKCWWLVQRARRQTGLRSGSRPGWIAVCLVAVTTGRAADDIVVSDDARLTRPDTRQHSIVLDQQIGGMLFGQYGGNEEAALKQVSARATLQLAGIDAVCGLTERQRRKGEAAVALVVAEIVADIEAFRSRYAGRVLDMQQPEARAEWQRVHQDIMAMQQKLQGAGGGDALLSGVIVTMLDDEQRSVWQREMEGRAQACWRRVIDTGLTIVDLQLGLTTAQREALTGLLDEKPLLIDEAMGGANFGYPTFQVIVCKYALSLVEQRRLREIIDDRQWAVLSQAIAQGKGMATHLKQKKIIVDRQSPAGTR